MKKLLLHFALAAVMLLGATVTASAEKVTENLSAVNKTCSIRVYKDLSEASPSYKGYITGTVIAMPTSSVPGLLSVSNLTTTQGLAGTNVSGDIDIPAIGEILTFALTRQSKVQSVAVRVKLTFNVLEDDVFNCYLLFVHSIHLFITKLIPVV